MSVRFGDEKFAVVGLRRMDGEKGKVKGRPSLETVTIVDRHRGGPVQV
jgi:hypothetical protein